MRDTTKRQNDRTTVRVGPIILGATGGSVPIEEMGRTDINGVTAFPCVVDPMASHSLFNVSLCEQDSRREQENREPTLSHPQKRRHILVSKFGGLYIGEDVSPTLACAVEATQEIKTKAADELLCHIPKMAEVELAVQPCCVRDGVSLDQLRRGHIDFDSATGTCNMMQLKTLTTWATA